MSQRTSAEGILDKNRDAGLMNLASGILVVIPVARDQLLETDVPALESDRS